MHKLYDLKEKLLDELEMYADKTKMTRDDVETVKYLSSAIDHICNIVDGAEEDGGSYAYRRSRSPMRDYGRSYRRDAMGRYSRAEDDFRMELQELIKDAPNEHIKQKMQSIMSDM